MSFESDYIKIFQAGLEPYGFKRMKGTKCFGKLINDEILLFIKFKKYSPLDRELKTFDIVSGVQTIYSRELSERNLESCGTASIGYSPNVSRSVMEVNFHYNQTNQTEVINQALQRTTSEILPRLLQIKDLESSIDYLTEYHIYKLYDADTFSGDSVLLFLTNNHDSFEEAIRQREQRALRRYSDDPELFKSEMQETIDIIQTKIVKARDKVWASQELQEELQKEIERRVEINRALLIQYKLLAE